MQAKSRSLVGLRQGLRPVCKKDRVSCRCPVIRFAAYHRARRARLKPEAKANAAPPPAIPLGRALTVKERRDDAEMERIGATAAAGMERCARPMARRPARAAASQPPVGAEGKHGRDRRKPGTGRPIPGYDPTFAPHDGYAVSHQVNTVIMLSALAARADERSAASPRSEAPAANRKAKTLDLAQMIFGLARAAFISGR